MRSLITRIAKQGATSFAASKLGALLGAFGERPVGAAIE
jgi:hypothetical protein